LQHECFNHVSQAEISECFIAKSFGWVFAKEEDSIVGQLELYGRTVWFEGEKVNLGGLGGTCVTRHARRRGIGTSLVKKGLEVLTKKGCDIACLNANVKDYPSGGLYHRHGFRLMKRPISFEDVYGNIRYDVGEMFIPVRSTSRYRRVMTSETTFHIGRGYW
jgi:predicted acetyltransferase